MSVLMEDATESITSADVEVVELVRFGDWLGQRAQGQQWRRLLVRFPETIATHSPEQVFYYDADGMQRRMDYVTEILGSTLVAHYCGHPKTVDGLVFPTRRRVFRRNPDGTSNLNMPSITIDIDDIDDITIG